MRDRQPRSAASSVAVIGIAVAVGYAAVRFHRRPRRVGPGITRRPLPILSRLVPGNVRAAWNAFRGRPTVYRAHITGGGLRVDGRSGGLVAESFFSGAVASSDTGVKGESQDVVRSS
jgi:hypothetical protein